MSVEEKRYYPRKDSALRVFVRKGEEVFTARMRDISIQGISFFLERELPTDAELSIKIDSGPCREPVMITGKVIRSQPVDDEWIIACQLDDSVPDQYLVDTFALINGEKD